MTSTIAAIPARWGSTRLPGKPLRRLAGKPIVQHVYERVVRVERLSRVVVLTDDERVRRAVSEFGGRCQMTPADCASGTDRIAWAAEEWTEDVIINVQGDEPLVDPVSVERLAGHLESHEEEEMATLATPRGTDVLHDPDAVKVVLDREGYALYFSRAPIPFPRHPGEAPVLLHLGLYGYRRGTLLRLADRSSTPLERSESLEQLRALEHGVRIRVLEVEDSASGIDTEEDLRRWNERLSGGG
ncbi:MAG: 3-deoxy-manno-octulosonate cytidylyltransferase [Thermoanaerobaculia bacterium]|nr:3-deoxy-manno-octulosonate cytidylyltransferase [Thermoanaerobaculia bacterium]